MKPTRRDFLQIGASGLAATFTGPSAPAQAASSPANSRRFHFVRIDVFTSHRLEGNQLAVFPDARGLSDTEMQDIARETNLQETTFVFPRDPAVELVDPRYPSGKKLMIGYLRALLMGGVAGVRAMTALCTRLHPIGFTGADNHA